MNLIIVESPTKAKTISRFLGSDFIVKSSFGHVRDLPKSELGIDLEHDFKPKYIIPTKAKKNVTQLKKDAAKADQIILATDPDREGEAISWHLVQALGLDKHKKNMPKISRIVFHEITESAIKEAISHPGLINEALVNAQQARRVLDRLVGYKLSPFLWKKVARGLSAGRVQSVAVRLIVEREREIQKFKPEEYWDITAILDRKNEETPIISQLIKIEDKTLGKMDLNNKDSTETIVNDLKNSSWTVQSIDKNEMTRAAPAPFTTSKLQQEGANKLRFSSKQTMALAQQLYQGVELGSQGSVGLITYMRTDSTNLSAESLAKAKSYITNEFGEKYVEIKKFKSRSKNAQEAHEAIRPTEPSRHPDSIREYLTPQQYKLYNLIWSRFIASQMPKAIFDLTAIDIKADKYTFRANGSVLKFDGWLKIYPTKFTENELPITKEGEILDLKELKPEQHFTKPPARFNEASLIKTLEKEGIGRPSTYAPIISTIQQRNYVTKDRSRYFSPTEIGIMVNDVLVEHFPDIVDPKFTSEMEEELDQIANGNLEWVPVVREFYEPFSKNLAIKYEEVKKETVTQQEETDLICEKCGSKMMIKMGRYGKFTACSNFPTCKNILKDNKDKAEPEKTGEICDKCGEGEMVIRTGRFGKFKACSKYPKCKNTKKIPKDKDSEEPKEEDKETSTNQ